MLLLFGVKTITLITLAITELTRRWNPFVFFTPIVFSPCSCSTLNHLFLYLCNSFSINDIIFILIVLLHHRFRKAFVLLIIHIFNLTRHLLIRRFIFFIRCMLSFFINNLIFYRNRKTSFLFINFFVLPVSIFRFGERFLTRLFFKAKGILRRIHDFYWITALDKLRIFEAHWIKWKLMTLWRRIL